jgi:DNA-binding NtrC family response regulator
VKEQQAEWPVLLVDDEPSWLNSLSFTLAYEEGIREVIKCGDSREVLEILADREVGAILLDLTMPYLSGEDLLPLILERHPEIPVIIVSGFNQIEIAVRCVRLGAFDYFVKANERERLIAGLRRALSLRQMRRENERLSDRVLLNKLEAPDLFAGIHTRSSRMLSLFRYIEAIASSRDPVLITGETGVGKDLVVRALHAAGSADEPCVAVNVAGLDDRHFSDALFGHVRGAFPGAGEDRQGMVEKAGRGTLLLDEIGDLSTASQIRLLRLLHGGEYSPLGSEATHRTKARLVCTTNRDLQASVVAGTFRRDLYYRLRGHRLQIPPLRERREDIPLLFDHILRETAAALGQPPPSYPPQLLDLLGSHHFPGNVLELKALIREAMINHQGKILSMESFKRGMGSDGECAHPRERGSMPPLIIPEQMPTLVEAATFLVEEAMRRAGGNQSIAANLLGITRQALNQRLKRGRR